MLLLPTKGQFAAGGKLATWPFALDTDHSESQGLQALAIATPFGFYDLRQGLLATRSGADAFTASEHGGLDAVYTGSNDGHVFPAGTALDYTAPFTLVWESRLDSFATAYPTIATTFGGGTNQSLILLYSSADSRYNDITLGRSGDLTTLWQHHASKPAEVALTAERHWGVWSYSGGGFSTAGNHALWINGLDGSVLGSSPGLSSCTDQTSVGGVSGSATTYWTGQIRQVRWYNRAWTKEEAIAFWHPATRDSLFVPESRRVWSLGAVSGPSAALTGTASTSSAGALSASLAAALSGTSAAMAVGAPTPSVGATVDLTGSTLSTVQGVLGAELSVTVVGVQALSASGSLSPSVGATAGVVGSTLSTVQGALGAALTKNLSGNSAATAVGTLELPGSYSAALTASQATGASGAVAPSVNKTASGGQSTASIGYPSSAGVSRGVSGGAVNTNTGALAAALSITIAGTSANSATGSLSVPGSYSAALGSSALSSLIGSLDASLSVGVSGGLATASAGTLTRTTAVIGSHADTAVGALTVSVTNAVTGTSSIASSGSVTVAGGSYSASLYGSSLTTSSGLLTVLGAIPGPGESLNLSSRIATTKMLSSPVRRSVSLVSRIPQ